MSLNPNPRENPKEINQSICASILLDSSHTQAHTVVSVTSHMNLH